jgi:hypothetical protein
MPEMENRADSEPDPRTVRSKSWPRFARHGLLRESLGHLPSDSRLPTSSFSPTLCVSVKARVLVQARKQEAKGEHEKSRVCRAEKKHLRRLSRRCSH